MDNNYKENIEKDVSILLKDFIDKNLPKRNLKMFTGKVEDNVDPDKLGRCKVRVFGIFDDKNISVQDLPWATPEQTFIGSTVGSFIVPPVGTLVRVYFDNDDIYSPVFTTKVLNTNQLPSTIGEDYPNTMVMWETNNGDYFIINRLTLEMELKHASGTSFNIDSEGNITINNTGSDTGAVDITVKGDVSVVSETGDVTVTASKGNVNLGTNANVPCPNIQNCVITGAPLAIGRNFNGTPGSVKIPL